MKFFKNRTNLITYLPYVITLLVFFINASWNISDHDDGHTLGYHAMGRNENIQRAYGPYDSMCDYLLSLLPSEYKLVYASMIGLTLLSALSFLFFTQKLLTRHFNIKKNIASLALIAFLISMPEFLYEVFTFKSVMIALNITIISLYVLLESPNSWKNIFLSSLLFGFGVSLRWNILLFAFPTASLYFYFLLRSSNLKKSIIYLFTWGCMSILAIFSFINMSGYTPYRFIETVLWGKGYMENTDFQLIARVADTSLFLTPVSLLLILLGFLYIVKFQKNRHINQIFLLSSILPIFLLGFVPNFKFLVTLWPAFILLIAYGISYLHAIDQSLNRIVLTLISLGIIINWFVGIQISSDTTQWGPGLEIKDEIAEISVFENTRADDRIRLENISVGLHDGFSIPTSEGVRPLYGHFYALFQNKLSDLDSKLNSETDTILIRAAHGGNNCIYQDRINPYLLASYFRFNYSTDSASIFKDSVFTERIIANGDKQVSELRINSPRNLFDMDAFYNRASNFDTIYLSFTYTSTLNKFLARIEDEKCYDFYRMGPMSAAVFE